MGGDNGSCVLGPYDCHLQRYLAEGLTNEQIATRMKRNTRTIEQHVAHIRKLLGVSTREEAVRVARQRGLLPPKGVPVQEGSPENPSPDAQVPEDSTGHEPPHAGSG